MLGGFFQRLAAFVVNFTVERVTVDVFRNVLNNVASGAAECRINGFHLETWPIAVLALEFFRILTCGVIFHHFGQFIAVLWSGK
ncbi:hypothetical protein D3C76_1725680 [compost metagenome]